MVSGRLADLPKDNLLIRWHPLCLLEYVAMSPCTESAQIREGSTCFGICPDYRVDVWIELRFVYTHQSAAW